MKGLHVLLRWGLLFAAAIAALSRPGISQTTFEPRRDRSGSQAEKGPAVWLGRSAGRLPAGCMVMGRWRPPTQERSESVSV
jgi:hypothetical protein